MSIRRRLRPAHAAAVPLAAGLLAALLVGPAAPAHAFENHHTAFRGEPAPMGQVNGPVAATEIAGGRIYAGGNFTSERPAGSPAGRNESALNNLAAFDATTGAPITSFHPYLYNDYTKTSGSVSAMALSPDGKTLYVGGDFNTVDGMKAEHIAAFDAATGAFKGQVGWNGANGNVRALAVSPDAKTLYVGGNFTGVSWTTRNDIAAIDLATGDVTPFAPRLLTPVSGNAIQVLALGVSTDGSKVFAAGPFTTSNGAAAQGFAALDAKTGANVPGFRSDYLAPSSFGTSLDVSGNAVYVGGRSDVTTYRTEGVVSINATTGAKTWYADCFGDTFGVLAYKNDVYIASHSHDCANNGGLPEGANRNYLAIHSVDVKTGKEVPYFVQTEGDPDFPDTLLTSRALAADADQLVMGGGFLQVNGQPQTNLTRFRLGSSAPERAPWPRATATSGSAAVTVDVLKSPDRDDINLTYKVYRGWDTSAAPIATYSAPTLPWPDSFFTVTDTKATPGSSVSYKVMAFDPAGNAVTSVSSNTVVVGSSGGSATPQSQSSQAKALAQAKSTS